MNVKKKTLDVVNIYRKATYKVFTTKGLIATFLLLIAFSTTYLMNETINLGSSSIILSQQDPIAIVVAIVSAILTMALWWILGVKYAPKLGSLLTEKKIMNILFTKGDFHYFEKVELENLRITPNTILNKFINLILSWFAVTAFLLGFFLPLFYGATGSDKLYSFFTASLGLSLAYILKLLIVFVFAPLLMSITVPIPWMLLDAQLKAYNSSNRTNSFVGKAVQTRVNSLFAIGGIVTLLIQNLTFDNIVTAIIFIFSFLAFPTILIVTLYNMLFRVQYYESFLKEIPVPFGKTRVEMETKFTKDEESENKEPVDSVDSSNEPNQSENKQEQFESTPVNTQQDIDNDSSESTST